MILFGDPDNKKLSEKIAHQLKTELFYPEIHEFQDTEKRVRILQNVQGGDVYVIQSLNAPVAEKILLFCFTIDALIRCGARSVCGVVPYLAYTRADHEFRTGEAVPLEVVISLLEKSGLSKIMVIDSHSIRVPELFSIPVVESSAVSFFADRIREIISDLREVSIVSPDSGGVRRCNQLSKMSVGGTIVTLDKNRDLETGELTVNDINGVVKKTCFILDDIIATGGTIIEAVSALKKQGAEKVFIMATHPVFVGNAVKGLENSGAEKVFVTDSIYVPQEKQFNNLEIITLADTIATQIRTWHAEFV